MELVSIASNKYLAPSLSTFTSLSLFVYVLSLSLSLSLSGNHDVYRLQAGSVEERDEWMKCIDVNLRHGSVYDNMTQRRRKITGIQGLDIPEIS